MFDPRPLLNPLFWLTIDTLNVAGTAGYALLAAFGALILASILVRASARRLEKRDKLTRRFRGRVATYLATIGCLGAALWGLSFEGIRVLGARFWFPTLLLLAVAWGAYLVREARVTLPAERAKEAARERGGDPYLPRPKK